MNLALMLVLATLAGVRTWRVLAVDCIGHLVRYRWDSLVWAINPKEFRSHPTPKRKNVSRWAWRRHRIAKSLADGFSCPFCMGFWVTAAWVTTGLAWSDTWVWQLAAGSLAASYVVGHLGKTLDAGDQCDDD